MPVTEEELRIWTRDFLDALLEPKADSLVDRFSNTIARQPNEDFRHVLAAVRDIMSLGYPLSKAMALHPDIFPEKYITIIRYGEIHGEVDLTLKRYLDRPEDMQPRCAARPAG